MAVRHFAYAPHRWKKETGDGMSGTRFGGGFFLLAAFAVSPLLSGFFAGFPFANHNESFAWVPRLAALHFFDVFLPQNALSYTYRPLADAAAWLLFHSSGGSVVPQQIWNMLVAALAWGTLIYFSKNRICSSVAVFFLSAFSFSGYIYLFHLHGGFYSPLLLFVVSLAVIAANPVHTIRLHLYTGFGALIAGLFHPFALLLYCAFLAGVFVERFTTLSGREKVVLAALAFLSGVALRLLLTRGISGDAAAMAAGIPATYRMQETFPAFGAIPFAMSFYSVYAMPFPFAVRRALFVVVFLAGALVFFFSVPLTLLWIAVCVAHAGSRKKIGLAFMLLTAAVLPSASPTGSPTYGLFVLPLCASSMFVDSPAGGALSGKIKLLIMCVIAAQVIIVAGLHIGFAPGPVARALSPLLGEKEKTHQMETIIDWYNGSPYRETHKLLLLRNAAYPGASGYAAVVTKRKFRAPAAQFDIDPYIEFKSRRKIEGMDSLFVAFGGERPAGMQPVFSVSGSYSGSASVFEPQSGITPQGAR